MEQASGDNGGLESAATSLHDMESEPPSSSEDSSPEKLEPPHTEVPREIDGQKPSEIGGELESSLAQGDIARLIGAQSSLYQSLAKSVQPPILGLQTGVFQHR